MSQAIHFIRALYSAGNFEEAKSNLMLLQKNYPQLNEEEQSFVIGMLINFGEYEAARIHLNHECDNTNNHVGTEFHIKKLLYYSQLKIEEQSIASAKKLFSKIIQFLKENNGIIKSSSQNRILSHLVSNLRTIGDYQTIIDLEDLYLYSRPMEVIDCFMRIEVLRAQIYYTHSFTKDHIAEIEYLKKAHPDAKTYSAVLRLHEMDIKLNFMELTFEELKEFEYFFLQASLPPTHSRHAYRLLGQAYYLQSNHNKACEYLQKALESCDSIYLKQAVLFWLNKITPTLISSCEHVLMKCAPTFAQESFLSGNRFAENLPVGTPLFYRLLKENSIPESFDCWVISRTDVKVYEYDELHIEGKHLDLKAGLYFHGKHKIILTDLRVQLLRLIISFGKEGAHQSFLIDAVFEGTYYYYESAKLRIKNLIVELNKLGMKIKRKSNRYFFDFDKNAFPIIFPLNHNYNGPIAYLKKSETSISRLVIEKKLNVKPSTASLYLKKWKDDGLIIKEDHQKYGEFSFVQKNNIKNQYTA